MEIILSMSNFIWGKILFYSLIPIGIYFTVRLGFAQFRYFFRMFSITGGGALKNEKGSVSPFQALMISSSARIGTGNLAGVAVALTVGGPGAIFWMWMVAFFGMGTAIIENSLGQLYKKKDSNGFFYGGPAIYMSEGIGGNFGKILAFLFAIAIILCYGFALMAVQSNTIVRSIQHVYSGASSSLLGILLVIPTVIIVTGGVKRIALFTHFMVPIMAVFYILIALYVFIVNITDIPSVFMLIIKSAFGLEQVVGGAVGYSVVAAVTNGVRRGLFSNESGLGSSPNAAAAATTRHPIEQGFVQSFGVFIDTIVICTVTALIILLSGEFDPTGERQGIELLQSSLSVYFGNFGAIFIIFAIFSFAYSSIIGNYYYGESNIKYLFKDKKIPMNIYRLIAFSCIYIGSVYSLSIWDIGDFFMGIMAVINLVGIVILSPIAINLMKDFDKKYKESKDPEFKKNDIPDVENVENW